MALSTSTLARYRPAILALTAITAGCAVFYVYNAYSSSTVLSQPPSQSTPRGAALHRSNARRRNRQSRRTDHSDSLPRGEQSAIGNESTRSVRADAVAEPEIPRNRSSRRVADLNSEIDALENRETPLVDSGRSWRDEVDNDDTNEENQNMLNLLYRIAEDQAKKEGYVHRGVTCNGCNTAPIQGIRYRCANCTDFDLCEQCEAMQIHPPTHLFYKVRIPVPFLANPRQPQPLWYPGKPPAVNQLLPPPVVERLCKKTKYQQSEIQALWDQFRCFANTEYLDDPNHYHLAIDRQTFEKCFVPSSSLRPTPPNLVSERLFAFYDTNNDGLIGFEEFVNGLSGLTKQRTIRRNRNIFNGYDINQDGYVDRKDFLRMFRAFYSLSKDMTKEIVNAMDEDAYEVEAAREIVTSSQPISSAFTGAIPSGERSRIGEGKTIDRNGDRVLRSHDTTAVKESGEDIGDHNDILADLAEISKFGDIGDEHTIKYGESMLRGESRAWPPSYATAADVSEALDISVALEDIENPLEREKVRQTALQRITSNEEERRLIRQRGIRERWQRQQFYIDNENGVVPPDDLKFDETVEVPIACRRSRSSSKVRFQDDLGTDEDYETRSLTSVSSRSIPVGERWGGYEVPEAEKDVGREILYQVTQEGLNDLLDPIFRQREELAVMVRRTELERKHLRRLITLYGTDEIQKEVRECVDKLQRAWLDPLSRPRYASNKLFDFFEVQFSLTNQILLDDKVGDDESANHTIRRWSSQSVDRIAIAVNTYYEQTAPNQPTNPAEASSSHPVAPSIQQNFTSLDESNLDIENKPFNLPQDEAQTATNSLVNAVPDPTFPQNRPNTSASIFAQSTASPSPSDESSAISTPPPSPIPSPRFKGPLQPYYSAIEDIGELRLKMLIACDQIEADDEARGGPGRLNYDEFNEVMSGSKGFILKFVGEWLDLARF